MTIVEALARTPEELTWQFKQQAIELGFPLVGVTLAVTPARLKHLHTWLEGGYAGQMQYVQDRREAYSHPSHILDGCRSVLMLGAPYLTSSQQRQKWDNPRAAGKVARYAHCGHDYHDVIRARLKRLKRWLVDRSPDAKVRGVVDTAPLLEREFAEAAGLGWIGKNTLLLNKSWGSYFFLAALLTDLELVPDSPHATSHCGTCTACLDHCPTQAFVAPYVLDANRCISYLTIEHRGPVDEELARNFGGWIFGCDICQEVCPWNRKSQLSSDESWSQADALSSLSILDVLELTPSDFERRYRATPVWRSQYRGMLRNAILLAGSEKLIEARGALVKLLESDDDLIRSSAAWALDLIETS